MRSGAIITMSECHSISKSAQQSKCSVAYSAEVSFNTYRHTGYFQINVKFQSKIETHFLLGVLLDVDLGSSHNRGLTPDLSSSMSAKLN